ncbi:Para-aminobenzoate synthase component 1 [Kingella potus]|uniref:Para-aminobenzoate synthase component 1 n=1 Tax=Kingella potus TaxID=265175 RepID=A0A377R2I7_9NEIS|nr:bifunctional anthranilate synthase component I family protein/aminotransferase class IV [Kingella potus]STR00968.1 Para-aminobenzoate synthase component 1 [Kingella potus]
MPHFVLADDAQQGRAVLFEKLQYSDFLFSDGLDSLDGLLRLGWARGLHVFLAADYAFGLPLQHLPPEEPPGRLALHWFAGKRAVDAESWLAEHGGSAPAGISAPQSSVSEAEYLEHIRAIQEAVARGDCYQINYTLRLHLQAYGSPAALYRRLRQPVPYAALCRLPAADGRVTWTLCFSPELFLKIGADGLISTEPMKGTAPILGDGQDEARALALRSDPKNRAENVMIVDLLRNDLGKTAATGSVRVPEPFKVSRFGSVWQMTSRIEAQAAAGTTAAGIFRAAFPCGSITGAPKRKSMETIAALETEPRGLYTGSIGFLNPCAGGLGFEGVLNVVIRTLELTPARSDGLWHGVYGVGSGIVADSSPQDEWLECGWKARFLTELHPGFAVFETLRVENRQCALADRHAARLQAVAQALNLPFPAGGEAQIRAYLSALPDTLLRLKITLDADGLSFSHVPFAGPAAPQSVIVSPEILPRRDYLRRFKTTLRSAFDAGIGAAERQGAFDSLFFNTDGLLLEGGRSNVFVKYCGQWLTPAVDLDILNGVMRQEILARPQHYLGTDTVSEARITRAMLFAAEEIRLSNALRGVFPVRLQTA